MATDAYRAWVAAHPSLDAMDDDDKDIEAALVRGRRIDVVKEGRYFSTRYLDSSGDEVCEAAAYSPTTDAAQAVELLSELAKSRGWRVHIMIDEDGTVTCFITDQLGTRRLANVIDTSEPRARTRACLAAMRGALEDDER